MSNKDEREKFFTQDSHLDSNKIKVEIPAEQRPTYNQRIPSGYDPMGEIYLRGRAARSISSGRIPWWILISGWLLFGGLFLLFLSATISSVSLAIIPYLIILAIPLLILFRGTLAKLSRTKR